MIHYACHAANSKCGRGTVCRTLGAVSNVCSMCVAHLRNANCSNRAAAALVESLDVCEEGAAAVGAEGGCSGFGGLKRSLRIESTPIAPHVLDTESRGDAAEICDDWLGAAATTDGAPRTRRRDSTLAAGNLLELRAMCAALPSSEKSSLRPRLLRYDCVPSSPCDATGDIESATFDHPRPSKHLKNIEWP